MPRRRPAQLRTGRVHRRPLHDVPPVPSIPGLSRQGTRLIADLERVRGHTVADALRTWSWFVRHPHHPLWDPAVRCGVIECCPDPDLARSILREAAALLPPGDARDLRRRIAALDRLRRRRQAP